MFVWGNKDCAHDANIGYSSSEYDDLVENFINNLRRQVECCNALQGFLTTHSVGGGTGNRIFEFYTKLVEEHFHQFLNDFMKFFAKKPHFYHWLEKKIHFLWTQKMNVFL